MMLSSSLSPHTRRCEGRSQSPRTRPQLPHNSRRTHPAIARGPVVAPCHRVEFMTITPKAEVCRRERNRPNMSPSYDQQFPGHQCNCSAVGIIVPHTGQPSHKNRKISAIVKFCASPGARLIISRHSCPTSSAGVPYNRSGDDQEMAEKKRKNERKKRARIGHSK